MSFAPELATLPRRRWWNRLVRRRKDFKETFASPQGQRVLAELADFCGLLKTSVIEGAPELTAVNEGKRMVFLHIAHILSQDDAQVMGLARHIEATEEHGENA